MHTKPLTKEAGMSFEEWTAELDRVAAAHPWASNIYGSKCSDTADWSDYFNDNWSPADAISEDLSHAD